MPRVIRYIVMQYNGIQLQYNRSEFRVFLTVEHEIFTLIIIIRLRKKTTLKNHVVQTVEGTLPCLTGYSPQPKYVKTVSLQNAE